VFDRDVRFLATGVLSGQFGKVVQDRLIKAFDAAVIVSKEHRQRDHALADTADVVKHIAAVANEANAALVVVLILAWKIALRNELAAAENEKTMDVPIGALPDCAQAGFDRSLVELCSVQRTHRDAVTDCISP